MFENENDPRDPRNEKELNNECPQCLEPCEGYLCEKRSCKIAELNGN